MFKKLNEKIKKSLFKANIISFLVNPSYFTRKGLYQGIKKNKAFITGKVLDFGCGQKPYKELFTYEEYIGLDIEESGHDHKNEQIDIFYDGKNIPFQDNYFDSIFTSEVFEHVANVDENIRELYRVLKENGHLLITVPLFAGEHEIPYDFRRYTSYGIKHLLEKNGFMIKKIEKKGTYTETTFQIIAYYIFSIFSGCKYEIIKGLLSLVLIFPINLTGTILSKILPNIKNTYLDLVVVAEKIGKK